jgi:hypothetical protein
MFVSAQSETFIQQGKKLLQQGKCEDAKKEFLRAKAIDPGNKDILNLINEADRCPKRKTTRVEITTSLSLPNGTEYSLPYKEGSNSEFIWVKSNVDWDIISDNSCSSWINLDKNQNYVSVTWQENTNRSPHTCTFEVKAKDKVESITITQQAKLYLDVDKSAVDFSTKGGKSDIEVNTNSDSWSLSNSGNDWCEVKKQGNSRLSITCDPNTKSEERRFSFNVSAGNESQRITIIQNGLKLDITPKDINFSYYQDRKTITISTTNADGWQIYMKDLPQGCEIESTNSNSITITCKENTSVNGRSGTLTIKAGIATEIINISQVGTPVSLSVSPVKLSFKSSGKASLGSDMVSVKTNATSWKIESEPYWCTTEPSGSYFYVTADKNKDKYSRKGIIKISAMGKYEDVSVYQEGKKYWLRVKDHYHTWGLAFGYVEKRWNYSDDDSNWGIFEQDVPVQGLQFGLRCDPYFAPTVFGLGLHTGIYYEYYRQKASQGNNNPIFDEHVLTAPLHLNYRIDFDEKGIFGIVLHGGLNFDYGLAANLKNNTDNKNLYDADAGLNRFNMSFGYGGGFHLGRFLFDFTASKGITNHSKDETYVLKQNNPLKVSMTIMFNN